MSRLSICIATYNRAEFIGQTLANILPQLRAGVELLVVDGASTDATESVVRSLFAGRDHCRYVRLAERGGVDRDYCLAVEHARGEYCWLMTDDDLLKPAAVKRVLEGLRGDPDLLVVNAQVAGPDLASAVRDRKLRILADRDFPPELREQLLALTGDLLTFIGAVVIRRDLWRSRDATPWIGTEFVHVGVIFQAPLPRGARVIAEPLVRIRYGMAQWTSRAFEVWMFKWPQVIWSLPGVSDAAKAAVCPREPWKHTWGLVTMKAQGSYTLEEYRRWLAPLPMDAPTRVRVAALAAFPNTLFNAVMSALLPLASPDEREMWRLELRRSRFDWRKRWLRRPG